MEDKIKIGKPENTAKSREQLEQVVIESLNKALRIHDSLGADGEEIVQKNQFGETALRADIECEKAILDFLREIKIPIRVISEEHGQVDITENPLYLGILDGLDGSNVYKKGRGRDRYGTMFGIFSSTNPSYEDYLACGIMEHSTKRLFVAIKNGGAFMVEGSKRTQINSSGQTELNPNLQTYVDEYFEINRKIFSEKLKNFNIHYPGSSAVNFADVASGAVDLALECTRKNNLEIAIAYGLETESGAVMVDLDGVSIGSKKYLEFGQAEHVPIITAATQKLARNLIEHLNSSSSGAFNPQAKTES